MWCDNSALENIRDSGFITFLDRLSIKVERLFWVIIFDNFWSEKQFLKAAVFL